MQKNLRAWSPVKRGLRGRYARLAGLSMGGRAAPECHPLTPLRAEAHDSANPRPQPEYVTLRNCRNGAPVLLLSPPPAFLRQTGVRCLSRSANVFRI
jgi:hypothetical protein